MFHSFVALESNIYYSTSLQSKNLPHARGQAPNIIKYDKIECIGGGEERERETICIEGRRHAYHHKL